MRYRGFCIGEPDDVLLSLEIQPTIIGDKAFHCPVRNGKEWGRSAMAVRQGLCFAGPEPCSAKLLGRNEPLGLRSTLRKLPTETLRKSVQKNRQHGYRIKPHGQLVPVSCAPHSASTPGLSTSWSRTTLQGGQASGKTNLQASFPLRCFQRLSLPHIATRQCDWRHNRYTRGASTPVLSY